MTDELRDRIARALRDEWAGFPVVELPIEAGWLAKADAVLGVLSPTDGWEQVGTFYRRLYEQGPGQWLFAVWPDEIPTEDAFPIESTPAFRRVDGAAPQPDEGGGAETAPAVGTVDSVAHGSAPLAAPQPDELIPSRVETRRHDPERDGPSPWAAPQPDPYDAWFDSLTPEDQAREVAMRDAYPSARLILDAAPPDGEVERLWALLGRYGAHEATCPVRLHGHRRCACGFLAALSGSPTRRKTACRCATSNEYHAYWCPQYVPPPIVNATGREERCPTCRNAFRIWLYKPGTVDLCDDVWHEEDLTRPEPVATLRCIVCKTEQPLYSHDDGATVDITAATGWVIIPDEGWMFCPVHVNNDEADDAPTVHEWGSGVL
jgi:hypothetical protein